MIEYSGQRHERIITIRPERLSQSAELSEISVEVLIWLASQPDHLGRFLELSGIRADQIRAQVDNRAFQQGLVNFIMSHEPDLIEFCTAREVKPERVAQCYENMRNEPLDKEISVASHVAG